jgi:hypothetical protein
MALDMPGSPELWLNNDQQKTAKMDETVLLLISNGTMSALNVLRVSLHVAQRMVRALV